MNKLQSLCASRENRFWPPAFLCVLIGLILTIVSLVGLCSSQCAEGQNWRLFGLPFEALGLVFFTTALIGQWLALKNFRIAYIQLLVLATGIGAELYFIYVQKYLIGTWCPICLSIAGFLTAAFVFHYFYVHFQSKLQQPDIQEKTMLTKWKGFTSFSAIIFGLTLAFLGVSKSDAMQAAKTSIKESLIFGNPSSNLEVYLFTDWACPACRKLEPNLQKMIEKVDGDAKVFFIDHAIHPETLNFVPYHLSFIINNKHKYYELRSMLTDISEKTSSPTEEQVKEAAARHGVTYTELNFMDIALAIKFYKTLGEKYGIKGTPTIVIINTETKKGKKLSGNGEITAENLTDAINTLKSQ
jgi:protein-disulfide isomerase